MYWLIGSISRSQERDDRSSDRVCRRPSPEEWIDAFFLTTDGYALTSCRWGYQSRRWMVSLTPESGSRLYRDEDNEDDNPYSQGQSGQSQWWAGNQLGMFDHRARWISAHPGRGTQLRDGRSTPHRFKPGTQLTLNLWPGHNPCKRCAKSLGMQGKQPQLIP